MIEVSVIATALSQLQNDDMFKHIAAVAILYASGKLIVASVPSECEAFEGKLSGTIQISNLLQSIWDEMVFDDKITHLHRKPVIVEYNKLCGAILV